MNENQNKTRNINKKLENMKGFKQCEKGHFYKDTLSECNYCPKTDTATETDKTEVLGGGSDKTSDIPTEKTQVFGGDSGTTSAKPTSNQESFDADKTIIGGSEIKDDDGKSQKVQRRKLRGWLVSFDIEDFGIDFKIIEGRNTIGSKPSNEVTVQDNEVSSVHALILCKKDKFILRDELSTNGTFLNGEELTPGDTFDLKDEDEIKVGNTTLLFKTAFKDKK